MYGKFADGVFRINLTASGAAVINANNTGSGPAGTINANAVNALSLGTGSVSLQLIATNTGTVNGGNIKVSGQNNVTVAPNGINVAATGNGAGGNISVTSTGSGSTGILNVSGALTANNVQLYEFLP